MSYTDYDFPHTHFYETDLRELLAKVGSYQETIDALNKWIAENTPKINEIEAFVESMQNADTLPESVKQALFDWASTHLIDLVASTLKGVYFGLTNDGYFVAYIPENWSDIIFGTSGLDDFPVGIDFGHLTLSY